MQHTEQMGKLKSQMAKLSASTDKMSSQLVSEQRKGQTLATQHRQVSQQKVALIKEVKKLRRDIIDKDVKKSELLEKMSQDELAHEQAMESVQKENATLRRQHDDVIERFKVF